MFWKRHLADNPEKFKFKEKRIFIAGSSGMVGSAVARKLKENGCSNLVVTNSANLNLIEQSSVAEFFVRKKPEIVILAAARVGGISANSKFRADFLFENLMIESNIINAAFRNGVEKLIFLGSSCIYPRMAPQPIKEEYLLTGPLEFSNEPYAVAKIAGIKLCESYFRQYGCNFYSVMPTNLYGPDDNFDLELSHVVPALIRKLHEAKRQGASSVSVWGTGKPRREFLYVDDLAEAIMHLLDNCEARDLYDRQISHINVGTGTDVEIRELVSLISVMVGFTGSVIFDHSKPDGTPRKLLDVSRIEALGWKHSTSLEDGLKRTYDWFLRSEDAAVV